MIRRNEGMRLRTRIAAIAGVAVFLVLAGTGAGYAYWTASSVVTASAQSTNAAVALTVPTALTATYTSSSTGPVIGALTLANTGGAPLGLALTASNTNASLSGAISLRLWLQTGGSCGTSVPASGVTTGTLAAPPALPTGATSAAAGGSVVVCAATAFTGTYATFAGQSTTVTLTLTGSVGTTWRPTATGSFTQKLASASNTTCTVTAPVPGYEPWGWNLQIDFTDVWQGNGTYRLYIVSGPSGPVTPVQVAGSGDANEWYPKFQVAAGSFTQPGVYTLQVRRYPSPSSNSWTEFGTLQITQGPVGSFSSNPIRCGA